METKRLPRPSELIEQSCTDLEHAISQVEGVVRAEDRFKREYKFLLRTIKALWKAEKYLEKEGY